MVKNDTKWSKIIKNMKSLNFSYFVKNPFCVVLNKTECSTVQNQSWTDTEKSEERKIARGNSKRKSPFEKTKAGEFNALKLNFSSHS